MFAEEDFVNHYNFNPVGIKLATIHVKNTGTQVKKGHL
jgi:hypothetical protein